MANEINSISTSQSLKNVQSNLPAGAPGATQQVMLFAPDGTPAGKCTPQQLITDGSYLGLGYGTCSTAATTVAKTVAVSNFLLLKNGIVSVLFTSANDAAGATLNVNGTGAKPIRVNGSAIQPGLIKAQTVVQMQYDGTAWNVVGMFGLEATQTDEELYVDMGLPSGVKWAKANIDITQENGFAASPYQYECSFVSWGNIQMYNPKEGSTNAFDHNWGGVNSEEPWYDGQVYGDTPGNKLTGNIAPSMDAARANLGAPWRMPTTGEFAELFNNINYLDANGDVIDASKTDKRVSYNGVTGLRLQSKNNGKELFFACSGYGNGSTWSNRGSNGCYWSASFYSARNARLLYFNSGGVYPQDNYYRYLGFAVRPVQ